MIFNVPFPNVRALGAVNTTAALLIDVIGVRPSPQIPMKTQENAAWMIPLVAAVQLYSVIKFVGLTTGGGPKMNEQLPVPAYAVPPNVYSIV